ncbi:MAG: Hsp33 family molecular chaperone HslO [Burkholderiaceae bacterium]
MTAPVPDRLLRFSAAAAVRGEYVELGAAWREVLGRHELPATVGRHLGELVGAALLLAATIKHDGALILQLHGDGPVRLVVVECRSDGSFRATVKLGDEPIADDADFTALLNASGKGRCVVTLDGTAEGASTAHTYQGVVPLDGATVAEVIERYMNDSEQIPTRLWLAADAGTVRGLMLQRMPATGGQLREFDEDAWPRLTQLAATLERAELLGTPAEQLLHRLFWQERLVGSEARTLRFACRCSRDKVGAMLRMLGREEVESVLAEQGEVEVRCEFCNEARRFDAVDCAALFVDGLAPESPTRQ